MSNAGFANVPRRVLRMATTICLLLVIAALLLNRLLEEEALYAAMTLCLVGALAAGITGLASPQVIVSGGAAVGVVLFSAALLWPRARRFA